VFTSPQDPGKPLGPWVIEEQTAQLRKKIKTHADAGLHALHHTFLTEAGDVHGSIHIAVRSGTR
jgi:hypothetical protein